MTAPHDSPNSRRKTEPVPLPHSERLARALEHELARTRDGRLQAFIERARSRVYDHYRGRLQYPRRILSLDLAAIGHAEMAYQVAMGAFDPSPEETSAWLQTTEAQTIMVELLHVTVETLRPYDEERAKAVIEEAARLARIRRAVYNHRGD